MILKKWVQVIPFFVIEQIVSWDLNFCVRITVASLFSFIAMGLTIAGIGVMNQIRVVLVSCSPIKNKTFWFLKISILIRMGI